MVIPSNPVSTYWGHISLVESDLKCFESLESEFSNWTHVMNLAGSELPTQPVGKIESTIRRTLGKGQSFAYREVQLDSAPEMKVFYRSGYVG